MSVHVAILRQPYLRMILAGTKTMESRLTMRPLPPFGVVATGDVIYLKQSAGPFRAKAIAGKVYGYDHLTPEKLAKLQHRFNRRVCGDDAYWLSKRAARYATFIELREVTPITQGPEFGKSHGLAWFVMSSESLQPMRTSVDASDEPLITRLTAGALRNRYLRVPSAITPGDITLHLPDGKIVVTEVTERGMVRHRQWRDLFAKHRPGDGVCFTPVARRVYRLRVESTG